jgi:apolipoprotein D and lipocalin family protein
MKSKALPGLSRPSPVLALWLPLLVASAAFLAGCATSAPPLKTVTHVDLPRYMGDWRVIAEIPYFAEKNCVDSIESYSLRPDGTIDNWFTYRKKSFEAPQNRITAHAFVTNHRTNAEWRVKFVGGLISADYLVLDLDPHYRWTVVGHPTRNYGWIMAREKTLPRNTYDEILQRLKAQKYDVNRFKKVPQHSSEIHTLTNR